MELLNLFFNLRTGLKIVTRTLISFSLSHGFCYAGLDQ